MNSQEFHLALFSFSFPMKVVMVALREALPLTRQAVTALRAPYFKTVNRKDVAVTDSLVMRGAREYLTEAA